MGNPQLGGKVVLVLGATGKQGGAAAARLLADGWQVRAYVRSPASAQAEALAAAGADIVAGRLGDHDALSAAMAGVHGVFSVQPGALGVPAVPFETEFAWGRDVADAALHAGVAHLVYASVAGAGHAVGVRAFEPKLRIERHIHDIGIPATILRPASFMENYADPAFGLGSGALATPLAADIAEQLVAVDDIGRVAATAFAEPGTYLGETVDVVGDALTPPQLAQALGAATGRTIPFVPVTVDAVRAQHPLLAEAAEHLNRRGGYGADITRTRQAHPGVQTFEQWLAGGGSAQIAALLP